MTTTANIVAAAAAASVATAAINNCYNQLSKENLEEIFEIFFSKPWLYFLFFMLLLNFYVVIDIEQKREVKRKA